ncbi:MAG: hypothetical protein O3B73_08530 [bacterium]|nr:hypothetical protein [bacterium]
MKRIGYKQFAYAMLFVVLSIAQASANTIFSFQGQGNSLRRVDARSRAMGGAGRALVDGLNFSTNNPALLAGFRKSSMSAQFTTQRRFLSGAGAINDGDVSGFHIVLPFRNGLVFGVALEPLTDMDYGATDTVGTGNLGYVMTLDASGGIQAVSMGVAQHFGQKLYAGIRVDWIAMGTFNERWTKTFFAQNVFFSSDDITRSQRGWVPALGLVYRPNKNVSAAANVQVGQNIRQRTTLTTRFVAVNADKPIERLDDIKLPTLIGGGLSYAGGYKWLVAMDVERGFWADTVSGRFNTWDISAGGLFRTGSTDMLTRSRRWELDAGMHLRTLYFATASGKQIREVGASFGLAIPLKNQSGKFRYVLEMGTRGSQSDHGVSERFIQQSFALMGIFQ